MNTTEFLKTQIQLLIANFGRRSVVEALASVSNLTAEQIDAEIAKQEANRKTKSSKKPKSLDQLTSALGPLSENQLKLVTQLGRRYESKQFLATLRNVEEFLHRNNVPPKQYKSRADALPAILNVLSGLSLSELESFLADSSPGGESDYSILAKQLMGKSRH
jgi:hypothetical protein